MPVSLTDLTAGYTFPAASFSIPAERARAYREATGDAQPATYSKAGPSVPPLAVVALALGVLLEHVTLPPGSLHASESLECHAAVFEGATIDCAARLAQRSVRAGWVVSVLETELSVAGSPVVSARATVLSPAAS